MKEITRLQQLAGILTEIKVNNPILYANRIVISKDNTVDGLEGYENFIEDYGNIIDFITPIIYKKYKEGEGIGEDLIKFIINNINILDNKYQFGASEDSWKGWLDQYKDGMDLPPNSSGGILGGLDYNDEWLYDENIAEIFQIDEDEIHDYYEQFKTW